MMLLEISWARQYLRWLIILVLILGFLAAVGGIPGTIARQRGLKSAGMIYLFGYVGLFTGLLWVAALVWSLVEKPEKPSGMAGEVRRPCPRCGESIAVTAKMCRFCDWVLAEERDPDVKKLL